jgi:hypothetical protein
MGQSVVEVFEQLHEGLVFEYFALGEKMPSSWLCVPSSKHRFGKKIVYGTRNLYHGLMDRESVHLVVDVLNKYCTVRASHHLRLVWRTTRTSMLEVLP